MTIPHITDRTRILMKGLLIGALVLIMLIPGEFVANLVSERQTRQQEVVTEVSSKWAGQQTVTGPVLMLPYLVQEKAKDGSLTPVRKMAFILPDALQVNGALQPKEKKRSLYSVMLYHAELHMTGRFGAIPLDALQIAPEAVLWQEARLAISVDDVRGIDEQVALNWNGNAQNLDVGVPENNMIKQGGLSVPVTVNAQGNISFSLNLSLKGSQYLYLTPTGKTTEVNLAANWKSPAFDGQYLPDTTNISDKSFTAHWKILPMAHTYPQYWKDAAPAIEKAAFGVRLIQPSDGYTCTSRSAKYDILFIALTFSIFFLLELMQKKQIHPLQYILVGLALIIFYTLLLSISEYTGFNMAYFISAAATISLVGMYVWGIFKSGKTAAGFTLALSALYTYIFVLIQSEDYALLLGSIGLFFIIAIIMYFSRKVDWYGITSHHTDQPGMEQQTEQTHENTTEYPTL